MKNLLKRSAQDKPKPTDEIAQHLASPVSWGPVAAVLGTVLIYFLSQYGALLMILVYPAVRRWSLIESLDWLQNSSIAQFVTILLIETSAILMLWWFLHKRRTSFKAVGWNRRPKWKDLGYALGGFAVYFALLFYIIFPLLNFLIPGLNFEQRQEIGFSDAHGASLILAFISLAILPPLVEETLTRGFLYTGLRTKLPKYLAALITSVMFAVAHLQLGSGQPALWTAAIDTFILSIFLVYLREKTDSLYAPVGLHFTKNSLAFLLLFVFHRM